MWKTVTRTTSAIIKSTTEILAAESLSKQQIRTTFVLKRRFPTQLHKKGAPPKVLRSRHYVYDLIKDTETLKQPNIDVILTKYVEGVGNIGDKVNVSPAFAYNYLLLPGYAVYASPDNLKKYENFEKKDEVRYSSAKVLLTVGALSRITLSVIMNKDSPWTLQPWHIKTSFRKCGFIVPEDAIEMPKNDIKGPDMNIENKEFFVTITINNTEKVNVRCRIHHWSTDITERLPYAPNFWKIASEPIFPEDATVLDSLPSKQKFTEEKQEETH